MNSSAINESGISHGVTQSDFFGQHIQHQPKLSYKTSGKQGKQSVKGTNRVSIIAGLLNEIGLEKIFSLGKLNILSDNYSVVKTFVGEQPVGERGSFIRELLVSQAIEELRVHLIDEFAEREEDESFIDVFDAICIRLRKVQPYEDVNCIKEIVVNYLKPYGNNPKSVRDIERLGYRSSDVIKDVFTEDVVDHECSEFEHDEDKAIDLYLDDIDEDDWFDFDSEV